MMSLTFLYIVGGIAIGLLSDLIHARAISSIIMMYLAVPTVSGNAHFAIIITQKRRLL